MIAHLIEGVILVAATVFIHGVGTLVLLRWIVLYRPYWERHGGLMVNTFSLTWIVGFLVLLHLLEVGNFAFYYYIRGVLPDLESSAYFSLLTYTTVGYGDVVLSKDWRLMGTSEALVGILMTAWSTALLISVVNSLHLKTLESWKKRDQEKADSHGVSKE
jgi:hypothetical protein